MSRLRCLALISTLAAAGVGTPSAAAQPAAPPAAPPAAAAPPTAAAQPAAPPAAPPAPTPPPVAPRYPSSGRIPGVGRVQAEDLPIADDPAYRRGLKRPSGFWTGYRPARGGAYRWRMLAIAAGVLAVTILLVARAIRRARRTRPAPAPAGAGTPAAGPSA